MARSFCLRVFAFPFGVLREEDLSRANHPITNSLVTEKSEITTLFYI